MHVDNIDLWKWSSVPIERVRLDFDNFAAPLQAASLDCDAVEIVVHEHIPVQTEFDVGRQFDVDRTGIRERVFGRIQCVMLRNKLGETTRQFT